MGQATVGLTHMQGQYCLHRPIPILLFVELPGLAGPSVKGGSGNREENLVLYFKRGRKAKKFFAGNCEYTSLYTVKGHIFPSLVNG